MFGWSSRARMRRSRSEAGHHNVGVEAALQDLERDLPFVGAVGTRGGEHFTHAPAPEKLSDAPGPDPRGGGERRGLRGCHHGHRAVEELVGAFRGHEHRGQLTAHGLVFGRQGGGEDSARLGLEALGLIEEHLEALPLLGPEGHGPQSWRFPGV